MKLTGDDASGTSSEFQRGPDRFKTRQYVIFNTFLCCNLLLPFEIRYTCAPPRRVVCHHLDARLKVVGWNEVVNRIWWTTVRGRLILSNFCDSEMGNLSIFTGVAFATGEIKAGQLKILKSLDSLIETPNANSLKRLRSTTSSSGPIWSHVKKKEAKKTKVNRFVSTLII